MYYKFLLLPLLAAPLGGGFFHFCPRLMRAGCATCCKSGANNQGCIMLLFVANMPLSEVLLRLGLDNQVFVMPATIVLGLCYSSVFTMIQLHVASLYGGGPAYGKILGLQSFIDTLALMAVGYVRSNMHKISQSCEEAFLLMAGLSLFSLVITFIINRQAQEKIHD